MSNQATQPITDGGQIFPLACKPGVRRDGTKLETNEYRNALWTRWHMGRARKIGGVRRVSTSLGEIYGLHVYPIGGVGYTHLGSTSAVYQVRINMTSGLGAFQIDRTPAGYTTDADNLWTFCSFYDDAVGTQGAVILAHVAPNLSDIDNPTAGTIYSGVINSTAALASITDASQWPPALPTTEPNAPWVSGGICVAQPFVFAYGSDGFVAWSDENLPKTWGTRAAGSDRITDRKIVYGTAARGSTVPTVLMWSLNALIRGTYSLGPNLFSWNTVSDKLSILSSRCVAEGAGVYYWPGKDCFYMYDGAVRELPNPFNADWFFESINMAYRQKVYSFVNTRFGEIWWPFPKDNATQCTHAIIFNYRFGYWYDTEFLESDRLAGYNDATFTWPLMTDSDGQLWLHEYGYDRIQGSDVFPIQAYYETSDLAYPTTGPGKGGWVGMDRWGKLLRVEPDWRSDQSGEMTMTVLSRPYAMSTDADNNWKSNDYTLSQGTLVKNLKETGRLMSLRFESNVQGGFFQQGEPLLTLGPDDANQA